jgi:hypothetical protein
MTFVISALFAKVFGVCQVRYDSETILQMSVMTAPTNVAMRIRFFMVQIKEVIFL